MTRFLEYVIRKRNPQFRFDTHLSGVMLMAFLWEQIGYFIRGYKLCFYFRNPKMALLGKGVEFFNLAGIKFGKFMKLGDGVYLRALGIEGIKLGNNVSIGAYSRLVVSTTLNHIGEFIRIGDNVGIGEFAYLGGAGGLEIGAETIVGQYFSCHPENHIIDDPEAAIRFQGVTRQGIRIGKNCWIGSKVTVLDGVRIGNGCVIAAGAVVTKSFPDNSIIGGVPARLLKTRTAEYIPMD